MKKALLIVVIAAAALLVGSAAVADCPGQGICWTCFHYWCWGQGTYCYCEASQVPPRYCIAGGGTCYARISL